MREQRLLRLLESGYSLLPGYARKVLQELVEGIPRFEIVEEVLEGDTGSDENGRAPQDFRVAMNHRGLGAHGSLASNALSIALPHSLVWLGVIRGGQGQPSNSTTNDPGRRRLHAVVGPLHATPSIIMMPAATFSSPSANQECLRSISDGFHSPIPALSMIANPSTMTTGPKATAMGRK